MWRKENPHLLWVGLQFGADTMENSMEMPQNIKNTTTLWHNNFTFGYLSEETQNTNSKRYMDPYVHCGAIYNSQDVEAT